ncbi:MAG: carbohydrate ABC transporter permease [Alphaproteobacteria bacterium]|nr:MAG: carbohydrate ABC transporter permease [Alphaproteobacteria bacterium]
MIQSRSERATALFATGLLIFFAIVWLLPFLTIILSATRSQGDLISRGVFSLPKSIRWENFVQAWNTGGFTDYFKNSLLLIFFKVPLGLLIASLAAYPLAKMRFGGSGLIFIYFLIGLAVPVQVTLQPLLVMMKNLGIANSLAALVPPYIAFGLPFQIFVMRGFFRLLPNELIEAARVDGASDLTIFFRIMLPLSLPPLATLAIIDALGTWNEFLIALVLISGKASRTVPVGLLQFQGEFSSQYTLLMAGVLISIIPVLLIFVFLQRYFVAGLAGGVKG